MEFPEDCLLHDAKRPHLEAKAYHGREFDDEEGESPGENTGESDVPPPLKKRRLAWFQHAGV